jgi:hypothetical protein
MQTRQPLHKHHQEHLACQGPCILVPSVQRALTHVSSQGHEWYVLVLNGRLVLHQPLPFAEREECYPLGTPTEHVAFGLSIH